MEKEKLEQIHEAAKTLTKLIEQQVDGRAIVMWGAIYEDTRPRSCSGISLGEDVDQQDLEHFALNILGRAYNMMEFTDED